MHLKTVAVLLCSYVIASLPAAGQPRQAQDIPLRPAAKPPSDIVRDNLDRVAATPEQISEVLGKDAGLMVEFKQLYASDAGSSGQVLDESDLSDAAIGDRLRQDLHTRILATRLLRRYGYLLPRINPDSDLAKEHSLELRERAQEIERASERRDVLREQPQPRAERTSGCEQTRPVRCQQLEAAPGDEMPAPTGRSRNPPRSGDPLLRQADQGTSSDLRTDATGDVPELSSDGPQTGASQTLLASSRQAGEGTGNARADADAPDAQGSLSVQSSMPPASLWEPLPPDLANSTAKTVNPTSNRTYQQPVEGIAVRNRWAADFQPVRMERQPNPYADVPSLYDLYVQAKSPTRKTERFGLDVFRSGAADPDVLPMDLPVGPDYVVGPGDSLSLNLWGGVTERFFRTVDREGRVNLPEVGPVLVSGQTLGTVQENVQLALRTQFRHVSVDVSLQRLRTVRVYVVGEVAGPGAYDISSLSTPLNALFAAGGVTPVGSLRRIEHYRGKQLVEEVDGYDLLLHGIRGEMQRLENGDSLRVPPAGPSVTVDGMVRRPASYELNKEKNLGEVLELAGGILPAAALRHIEVQRIEAHEKRTMLSLELGEGSDKEILRSALEKFTVRDGDEVHIFPIAPYNGDAVYLDGHVLRPGRYSYHDGMKLTDLVTSYKDLLPEPSGRYAEIIHITPPDYRPVVESFDLAAALAQPASAPNLARLDTVRIFGRYDFEGAPEIMVTGEVRSPGRYRTSGQQHLRDALYQAGGVTPEAWLDEGQLFRENEDGTTKVFSVDLRDALDGNPLDNLLLGPRDRILIHRQPQKVDPASVMVQGEVARPGRYPLTANMRVSDLVRSAGGLLRGANPAGGDLTHFPENGTTLSGPQMAGSQKVDLAAALARNSVADTMLRDGDVLTVPQQPGWKDIGATVTIRGEVGKPGVYGIQPGERLSSVLRRAGGLLPTAYPEAADFERIGVRELQQQSRQEMIQRLETESVTVKTSVTSTGAEEAALQQAAIQQKDRVLQALRRAPVSGRLVVHVQKGRNSFAGSPYDIELRPGDTLNIPKKPGFVLIAGQVYNSNAITYRPGKNAGWYLARAGGATQLANTKVIFILRADGEVSSSRGGVWTGGVLAMRIGPGDTIIVPEKTVAGGTVWKNLVAIAQIAQAGALAAAVAIP